MNILDTCDLTVVGGGASGLMCAFTSASEGCSVVVLDGNRQAGRKLRITGKGRGNVTNRCTVDDFMKNIPGDGRFFYSALNRFSPEDNCAVSEAYWFLYPEKGTATISPLPAAMLMKYLK